jgi:hypothetical protein
MTAIKERAMTSELWGTFSVKDHLAKRAFVSDVLLYDRLVIPTMPDGDDEAFWPDAWNLPKQRALLGDLGELAIPIPWDKHRRLQWKSLYDNDTATRQGLARAKEASLVEQDVLAARSQSDDDEYRITRQLLQNLSNNNADDALFRRLRVTRKARPGAKLETVCAYPSFDAFADNVSLSNAPLPAQAPRLPATAVFGWQFFVPTSADESDAEDRRLLEKAVRLAKTTEFLEMREEFYKWWSDVVESGMSAEDAKADMENRIVEYHKLLQGQNWKTAIRYVLKIMDSFTGGLGLVSEAAAASAELFLGSADLLLDMHEQGTTPPRLKVGAMFHDARKHLGWQAARPA